MPDRLESLLTLILVGGACLLFQRAQEIALWVEVYTMADATVLIHRVVGRALI